MFASVLTFIATPMGRFIGIALSVLILIGIVYTAIKTHDENVRIKATTDYNQKQIGIILEEQQRFATDMKIILDNSRKILTDLDKKDVEDVKKVEEIKKSIETVKDVQSSEVLKKVIEGLTEGKKP